jgi:hypothetical protein
MDYFSRRKGELPLILQDAMILLVVFVVLAGESIIEWIAP